MNRHTHTHSTVRYAYSDIQRQSSRAELVHYVSPPPPTTTCMPSRVLYTNMGCVCVCMWLVSCMAKNSRVANVWVRHLTGEALVDVCVYLSIHYKCTLHAMIDLCMCVCVCALACVDVCACGVRSSFDNCTHLHIIKNDIQFCVSTHRYIANSMYKHKHTTPSHSVTSIHTHAYCFWWEHKHTHARTYIPYVLIRGYTLNICIYRLRRPTNQLTSHPTDGLRKKVSIRFVFPSAI